MARRLTRRRRRRRDSPAARLAEAERLFLDFRDLTPYRYRPFVKTFSSFKAYEQWKHAQANPWVG